MKNPFGPEQDPLPSYTNLQKRMLERVQAANVDDQIFQVVQQEYEKALRHHNLLLSRPERQRMFAWILKQVLEDMVRKLDQGTK